MNTGVAFAILSLCFAGIYDVLVKKYSRKSRSRGMYIFGSGIVWTILQGVAFKLSAGTFSYDMTSVGFGLLAGTWLVLSNILFLESFTHIDVSLGSTVYRLNTIGVVVLSILLLGEPLGVVKGLGVLLGLIAVSFLYQRSKHHQRQANYPMFFVLAIFASAFRSFYGVTTKGALMHQAKPQVMLFIIAAFWIVGGALYAITKEKSFRLTGKNIIYSVISGSLAFSIANCLMLAVEHGQASVVIPIANMSFIVALTISAGLRMEQLTPRKILAVIVAGVSIILLSMV